MWVEILIAVVTIAASIIAAWKFGDVAGTRAAIEYEEKKQARARLVAVQALLNEVKRIRALAEHNSKLNPREAHQNAVKLPTAALETAFQAGESNLLDPTAPGQTPGSDGIVARLSAHHHLHLLANQT
jgi:hypothetical protein